MLDLPAHRISALARTHLVPWLERFLPSGWPARAQRTSARVLARVLERFPNVAVLVSGLGITPSEVPRPAPVPREARIADAELEHRDPDELVHQLEAGGDWHDRARAARALAHIESPLVIDALVYALRDPSAEVAAAVVDALAAKDAARVTDVLHEVVGNSDGYFSPITRAAAIAALARRADMTRVFAAVHDLEAAVSVAAIAAIAEHAPQAAATHLLPVVRDRSNYFLPLTRVAAARALERNAALSDALASELLATESDELVRAVLQRRPIPEL
jgi:HEAT repeat protein